MHNTRPMFMDLQEHSHKCAHQLLSNVIMQNKHNVRVEHMHTNGRNEYTTMVVRLCVREWCCTKTYRKGDRVMLWLQAMICIRYGLSS